MIYGVTRGIAEVITPAGDCFESAVHTCADSPSKKAEALKWSEQ